MTRPGQPFQQPQPLHVVVRTQAMAQACGNCALYQGKTGDDTANCPLFAGKQVAAKGWCSAWAEED